MLVAYLIAGMSVYDGFAHTFTTVSTGGFSPHNASLRHFESAAIEWIAIVAMFLAGGSFALYYRALRGQVGPLLRSTELHVYALAVASYAHRAALRQLHPRLVRPVRVGNRTLPDEIAQRIVGYVIMALAIFGGGAVLIALTGPDMTTSFSAAASAFGNVGPGLGDIDPTGDYLTLPATARAVTMAQLLLGRLEIYPVILALSVVTLRRRVRSTAT